MAFRPTEEFRSEAVRVALTSGLPRKQVATDLGIGFSTLSRWIQQDRPIQKWAGDISYVWTQEGWLYLAVILDLHSRRVVGWAVI